MTEKNANVMQSGVPGNAASDQPNGEDKRETGAAAGAAAWQASEQAKADTRIADRAKHGSDALASSPTNVGSLE